MGGVLGGALSGAAAGFLGAGLAGGVRAGLAVVVTVAVVIGLVVRPARPPQRDHETPQSLMARGPIAWATGNAFLLGSGVTSRIGFWVYYLVPVSCFATGSPYAGAVIWATYGGSRAVAIVALAFRMSRTPARDDTTARSDQSLRVLGHVQTVRRCSNVVAVGLAGLLVLIVGG